MPPRARRDGVTTTRRGVPIVTKTILVILAVLGLNLAATALITVAQAEYLFQANPNQGNNS
jgi:hypothetical protein